jgi:hypothetical protein
VTVVALEPHLPKRLDETVSYYGSHWERILLPHSDDMHRKQVNSGGLAVNKEGEFSL